jgi:hypothetical protein
METVRNPEALVDHRWDRDVRGQSSPKSGGAVSSREHHLEPLVWGNGGSVQAGSLPALPRRAELESPDDLGKDFPQLEHRQRGAEASALAAPEWKPRALLRAAPQKPLWLEAIGFGVGVGLMKQRERHP